DWQQAMDYLQYNPSFHSKPCYDNVLFQLSQNEIAFTCLLFMFLCNIPNFGKYDFAFVQPYTANISATCRSFDNDFRITHVKAHPHMVS
ncbi:hypothetical protein F5141DRAFT_1012264, partial [Pisolithus sp. B1]